MPSFIARLALAGFVAAAAALPAAGEETDAATLARNARQAELEAITRDIALTGERQAELRGEIAALDKDRATLNSTLIETGERVKGLETQIGDTETRLSALSREEEGIRASLLQRRDVLAEVLGALQRMGHRPPPAILVRPEDALSAVRSAILLGSVVPDLRSAATRLAQDLRQMVALRTEMERERDRLRSDATALAEERERVALLMEEKRNERVASEAALAEEEQKAAGLAEQATSLKDLIGRMEKQIAAAARAAARAAAAAEENRGKGKATSLGRADRLAPAVNFAEAKGLLPMPAAGSIVRRFGENDGLGAKAQGLSLATRASAQVNSPADGWVVYSGTFRSYGQLLIINAGDGYHVLLAGMERIDVELGQFVLAGEPVAMMASQRLASVGAIGIGATRPTLYIEFRKDGTPLDPTPWWAGFPDAKVGG